MSFATGSQVEFTVIAESTYGTTPSITPGDTQFVPFISNNLNLTKAVFEDPSIQANRQSKFSRHGNREVGGDISFAYSHEAFDIFFESLCSSTFSSEILKIGQTQSSMTVQVAHQDITQNRIFTGLVANTFNLEVNLDGVVQSTFGLMGKDMTVATSDIDSAPTAAPDKQPFVHFDGTFKEGGSAIAILTGISLSVDNQNNANYVLGSDSIDSLSSAMIKVEGTVTAYFQDAVLLNKFINETASTIEFTLDDGEGNTHTFLLPNVKYNGADIQVSDGNTVPVTLPFVALYDGTEATSLKITRSA